MIDWTSIDIESMRTSWDRDEETLGLDKYRWGDYNQNSIKAHFRVAKTLSKNYVLLFLFPKRIKEQFIIFTNFVLLFKNFNKNDKNDVISQYL